MSDMLRQVDYSGQKEFYNPDIHAGSITVIGAGGIGSSTIMGLSRMGVPNIRIYDNDEVDESNVTCQNYRVTDIGLNKAKQIAEMAREVRSIDGIHAFDKRISSEDFLLGNIIISAVDSMKSRKEIYEAAKKSPSVHHIIDGRLGGTLIQCYTIDIRDKSQVEYYLSNDVMFDDSEMEENICTARHIADVGYAVAALIIRATRLILTGKKVEKMQMLNMETMNFVHM